MRWTRFLGTIAFGFVMTWNFASADWPASKYYRPRPCPPCYPGTITYSPMPVTPAPITPAKPGEQAAEPLPFAQPMPEGLQHEYAPGMDTAMASAAPSANPQMLGDFLGYSFFVVRIDVAQQAGVVFVPDVGRGGFKIAENESPRPVDRVFLTYNYFGNINGAENPSTAPRQDLHRETLGFEKTFWCEDASIGLRLPLLQARGLATFGIEDSSTAIGDLSIVTKFALINDHNSGDVLSGGLVITVPSGEDMIAVPGIPENPTLLQPWMGFIWNVSPDCFVHGFTSIIIPTENEYISLLSTDLGVGYWLYRSPGCADYGIVPTLEVHITNPLDASDVPNLDQEEPSGPFVGFVGHDQVVITAGTHFLMGPSSLTLGVATGVAGPRAFDIEAVVQWNYRF